MKATGENAGELLAGLPANISGLPDRWAAHRNLYALFDDGRAFSYSDLAQARDAIADQLAALGVRHGDRVMLVSENCAAVIALSFAIAARGAWIVNVNARLSAREIDAIREHSGARRVIYTSHVSKDANGHAERHGAVTFDCGAWGAMQISALNLHCSAELSAADGAENVAALIYTSGTTGQPKGVMLTHRNLLFIAAMSSLLRGLRPSDRIYGTLPISHVYGLASVALGSLVAGACLYLQARYSPQAMAGMLADDGITVSQGVPAMYAKLLEFLQSRNQAWCAPALHSLYAGGSPLDPALKAAVEAVSGLTLNNGYGLTEGAATVTQTRNNQPRGDCSVGHVLPGEEIRIVNPDGLDVPWGEAGELWIRGPNIMKGYYRDAELTAQSFRPGSWLNSGDLARQDADGALFIVGRTKELIIRSGFNVYPIEVEAVLNAHPEVTQSAVVGREVEGFEGNEEVVAFVELKPGAKVTVQALQEFAAAGLAAYKRPAEIIVLPALPAAPSGKILKHRLKEMAQYGRQKNGPQSCPDAPLKHHEEKS